MSDVELELAALQGVTLADRYRLEALLGAGGMSYVYRAVQLPLGRSVAVKVLRPDLLGAGADWFRTEAMAASRINHPHAVSIFDFGTTADGVPYLVMEHLRGRTLAELVDDGPFELPRAIALGAQILSALAEAHDCGVIHCDLSSDNVIVERFSAGGDFAKVIDFGLARLFDAGARHGGVVGTPEYMSPEQIRGEILGPTTDLYAFGAMFYEMLVGRTPFAGSSVPVILEGHLHAMPPLVHELVPSCPREISRLVAWALAKATHDRPPDARMLRDALLAVGASEQGVARCPECGEPARGGRFCGGCGAVLAAAAPTAAAPQLARGSRRPGRNTSRITGELERPVGNTPAVGRDRELAALTDHCRGLGDARPLAITGPPGVGKARLLLEAQRALRRSVPFYVTAADPGMLGRPWFPIIGLLEQVLGCGTEPTLDALSKAVARVGLPDRDVPGLAEIFGVPGPARDLELAVRRREAHAAGLRALATLRRRHPRAVIAFVDADAYDQPSRRLVAALAGETAGSGLRVVLTLERDAEVPAGFHSLALSPLGADATQALARALLGHGGTLPSSDEIHTLTGGSPGAVEQLVGWLEQIGSSAGAPSLLVDLVSTRISRLPMASRRVLQAVAVHGCTAPHDMVAATVGDAALIDSVGSGITGLLQCSSEALIISSDLVRDVVVACTPVDVLRGLHRRALSALDERTPAIVSAYHAEGAGEHERAYHAYLQAGEDAVRRFDDVGASRLFRRALDCARLLDSLGDARASGLVVDAALLLADVLRFTGRTGLAAGILDEAEPFHSTHEQRTRIAWARGRTAMSANEPSRAVKELRVAVGHAVRLGNRSLICHTYIDLARALDRAHRPADATRELAQVIDVATAGAGLPCTDGPAILWYVGLLLAERQLEAGKLDAARDIASGALDQARRSGSARGRARTSALLAKIYDTAGEPGAALRYLAHAIDEMRALGDRRSTAELLIEGATQNPRQPTTGLPATEAEEIIRGDRGLRVATRLAREVGWPEGIMLSKRARTDPTEP